MATLRLLRASCACRSRPRALVKKTPKAPSAIIIFGRTQCAMCFLFLSSGWMQSSYLVKGSAQCEMCNPVNFFGNVCYLSEITTFCCIVQMCNPLGICEVVWMSVLMCSLSLVETCYYVPRSIESHYWKDGTVSICNDVDIVQMICSSIQYS